MKRVLITGMSGTGKSTVIRELAALGYRTVDTDDDWPAWLIEVAAPDSPGSSEWIWREDLMEGLLSEEGGHVLFVSGTARNQGKFYPRFDHIILLSAPAELMVERLATRTNNPFGKSPQELARILEDKELVEPLLQRRATKEIDTSVPVDKVVAAILEVVRA